jgi:hypothetical protein
LGSISDGVYVYIKYELGTEKKYTENEQEQEQEQEQEPDASDALDLLDASDFFPTLP